MAPTLVGPWSCGHPVGTSLTDHFIEQTKTNMSKPGMFCKRCGVGNISKHKGVGHRSVPCRLLFLSKLPYYDQQLICKRHAVVFINDNFYRRN